MIELTIPFDQTMGIEMKQVNLLHGSVQSISSGNSCTAERFLLLSH
jgi:hypothetical protein